MEFWPKVGNVSVNAGNMQTNMPLVKMQYLVQIITYGLILYEKKTMYIYS